MKGFYKVNGHCVDLRAKYSSLVAHVDYPSTLLPKWQKHLPHKLHSQPHLLMETTSYGEAWRAFRKQNFGLCSTYYSTVSITCTQTRIHRTQSLHYDKSLKRSPLRHIVTTNFAAMIYRGGILFCFARYHRNRVLLERYLDEISWRLYQYLADLSF